MKNILLSDEDVEMIDGMRSAAIQNEYVALMLQTIHSGVETCILDANVVPGDGDVTLIMRNAVLAYSFYRSDFQMYKEMYTVEAADNIHPIKPKRKIGGFS